MNCPEYIFEEVFFVVLVPVIILFGLTSSESIVLIEVGPALSTPPLVALIVDSGTQMAVSDKFKFVDHNIFQSLDFQSSPVEYRRWFPLCSIAGVVRRKGANQLTFIPKWKEHVLAFSALPF